MSDEREIDVRATAPSAVDVMERVMQSSGKYAGDAAGDAVRRIIAALRADGWEVSAVQSPDVGSFRP